jgi:hypothetical protein
MLSLACFLTCKSLGAIQMTEAEIEIVAEELAKLGGTAWYPGRGQGPIMRVVHERYRDRAKAAIAALDRYRASNGNSLPTETAPQPDAGPEPAAFTLKPGTRIVYRPPGDRRTYPCTVKRIRNGFAYLEPENRSGINWVPLGDLAALAGSGHLQVEEASGDPTNASA